MTLDAHSLAIAFALLAGLALGAFAAVRFARGGQRLLEEAARRFEADLALARQQLDATKLELDRSRDDVARLDERATRLAESLEESRKGAEAERAGRATADSEAARLRTSLAELNAQREGERKAAEEKLALLREAKEVLSNQFEVLANQILEQKSQKFAEQNRTALGALLDPLRTQLTDFKGKVEEVYVQETKGRSALEEQVKQLLSLNRTLSQDAQNLTDALKGKAQVQGAWGEWVMEEMFTSSGLLKDEHYSLQDSRTRDDGSRGRPDALVNLPGGRQLVVDSKASLVAYEQYASAKTDDERAAALRAHLESMKKHITGLSVREYQKLYPTMDFVMMFVPLEPAFMLAAANDRQLFSQAWEKNVLLVSPSTFLFVLRTVAYLWRQESQSRNAQDIAKRGALLHEKFCDFVRDLESVGDRLRQAQVAYDEAAKKLSTGSGNLVSQAQKLEGLGVKSTKKIPATFIEGSEIDVGVAEQLASLAASNTPRESDGDPAAPAAA
ncbi:DNA recombination protein RmuC [Ramlibacter sp. PS4R-6]|uniref:DNA recombination protein RmuC n=1 Tax=Ramlibacter sp. PS4R-6 TaxID=3133438 RepID=UPI0030ABFCEE